MLIYSSIHAQNEYDFLGKGARAAGMGYAFNAVSDDATAMSWNPAGLIQIKNPEVDFTNSVKAIHYEHSVYSDRDYSPVYHIDFLGFVYPVKLKMKNLVFGLSYQNKINYKIDFSTVKDTSFGYQNGKNKITLNTLTFSSAFTITRFLGAGISINRWFSLGNQADYYSFSNTRAWDKTEYPFIQYVHESYAHSNYSGTNFEAGIMIDLSSFRLPLRFAVNYETGFVLKNEHDVTYQWDYQLENNTDSIVTERYTGIEKYNLPGIIHTGLSYRFGDYLTLACDFDIRPYKDNQYEWDYVYLETMNTNRIDTISHKEYLRTRTLFESNKNLNQFRIGLEYILHPKFALIPIRAGWKNNPTTLNTYREANDEVYEPDKQVIAYSVNFGTGYIAKRFSIDLAYEAYWYKRRDSYYYQEKKVYHFITLSAILYIK
ncbi:MAG: outer membrane protein transport protein [Bacteroidales bacterium]|nr:outer membrane protein transport protein [Bacteroidales bacterium]